MEHTKFYHLESASTSWTYDSAREKIHNFKCFSLSQKNALIQYLNRHFPPEVYEKHRRCKASALENQNSIRNRLLKATQHFPRCISSSDIKPEKNCLTGFGIILTAGGEGERLRLSLRKQGISSDRLKGFTKATFPLPDFYNEFGALHINLSLISSLSEQYKCHIPVIVTTGPESSISASVVVKLIDRYSAFGIKHLKILFQSERLHLTSDDRFACKIDNGTPFPVTHPDETGGPIMKLKKIEPDTGKSMLDWLSDHDCHKVIVLQGTAVYHQDLIPVMAEAAKNHDGLGVGIFRKKFPADDPFGSFVKLKDPDREHLFIIEKDVHTKSSYQLKDISGKYFLPFNTGFYALDCDLLQQSDLPDYATPPKEVLPDLPRSPKIGYAATDLLPLAQNPAVLAISENHYGVIKESGDLAKLTKKALGFGLKELCKKIVSKQSADASSAGDPSLQFSRSIGYE
ncbi:MAG: hypothetical protein K9L30_15660 [Desulfobacterales bacterium]|nr:hypothetical protein [Desulfobacterales bacterium]